MTKIKLIGDLFRVYFLYQEYFYIELLRDITKEDFTILSRKSNALDFILNDDPLKNWELDQEYPHKAKFIIKLTLADELDKVIKCETGTTLRATLNNKTQGIFTPCSRGLNINFNYKGCSSDQSRNKKLQKVREKLILKIKESHKNKEEECYKSQIQTIRDDIDYINNTYNSNISHNTMNSYKLHEVILAKNKRTKEIDTIREKNKQIEQLKKEIEELSANVEIEYKEDFKKEITSWKEIPTETKRSTYSIVAASKSPIGVPTLDITPKLFIVTGPDLISFPVVPSKRTKESSKAILGPLTSPKVEGFVHDKTPVPSVVRNSPGEPVSTGSVRV